MEEISKLLNDLTKIENIRQLGNESQFDRSSEHNNSYNEFEIIGREEVGELRLYDGDRIGALNGLEATKLFNINPELRRRYNRLKRMIANINEEMNEIKELNELEKEKEELSKRKKKEEDPEKLAKKIGDNLIIDGFLNGKISIQAGADLLNISCGAFSKRVYKKKKEMGINSDFNSLKRNVYSKIVSEDAQDLIHDYITRNCDTTLSQVKDFLLTKKIDITKLTISRVKHKIDLIYKQGAQIKKVWNNKEIILKRKQYIKEYKRLIPYEFIYIDEIYFNRHTISQSERGSERLKILLTPESTRKSINYIVAISKLGIESYKIIDRSKIFSNVHDDFEYFMYELYLKNKHKRNVYVFNSANTDVISDKLKKSIQSCNSFILTLPEYSVFLSPLELFFNALKFQVNSLPHYNNSDIIKNIIKTQSKVGDAQHCENYFQQAGNYISPCENGSMFKGSIFEPDNL